MIFFTNKSLSVKKLTLENFLMTQLIMEDKAGAFWTTYQQSYLWKVKKWIFESPFLIPLLLQLGWALHFQFSLQLVRSALTYHFHHAHSSPSRIPLLFDRIDGCRPAFGGREAFWEISFGGIFGWNFDCNLEGTFGWVTRSTLEEGVDVSGVFWTEVGGATKGATKSQITKEIKSH